MINWEQKGVKPAGDDVLTPAVVADPQYGCKFTDNNFTADDGTTIRNVQTNLVPRCGA